MEEVIAKRKKSSYSIISIFIVLLIYLIALICICITASNLTAMIIIGILFFFIIIFMLVTIIYIHKKRQKDDVLIFYKGRTFYFPTLMLKIGKKDITRAVYELNKILYYPIKIGNFIHVAPMKNNVGKLHITYMFEGKEYYFKLKKVLNPDVAEKRIKEICGL